MFARSRLLFLTCAVLAIGGVALALVLQHVFDMQPCAWCTFQRLVFLGVGALALIGWAFGRSVVAVGAIAALTLATSAGGLWAALHQQFVASKAQSCVFTFADRTLMNLRLDESFPWLFEATASCADANVALLGVPFAFWSAALFVATGVVAAYAWRAAQGVRRAPHAPIPEVSR